MASEFLEQLAAWTASEIEIACLNQAVQVVNEAKSQFVSIMTHELRNPFTSIKGYTVLVLQGVVGPVNEQQQGFLKVVRNNADRMTALISNLSDISRIERGILKLTPVFLKLHGFVKETINNFKPNFEDKSQQVHVEVPKPFPGFMLIQIGCHKHSLTWSATPGITPRLEEKFLFVLSKFRMR